MTNRIKDAHIFQHALTPVQAWLSVGVDLERLDPETKVRVQLTGPRCVYGSTVEVAYPCKPLPPLPEREREPHVSLKAVIPEPNCWDPSSPFLYQASVELWQGEECCEKRSLEHGIHRLAIGPTELRWNEKELILQGRRSVHLFEEAQAREWHHAGCNTLLVPVGQESRNLWKLGDRFGFLMLGQITGVEDLEIVMQLERHTSSLGCLMRDVLWEQDDDLQKAALSFFRRPDSHRRGHLIGLELSRIPSRPLPDAVTIVACRADLVAAASSLNRPILLLDQQASSEGESPANLLGRIEVE